MSNSTKGVKVAGRFGDVGEQDEFVRRTVIEGSKASTDAVCLQPA